MDPTNTLLSRRQLLSGAAHTLTLGALAPALLSGCSTTPGPAYAAWRQKHKGALTDLEYIAQCGTLAASPHNTQPWKFRLLGNRIQVFADRERHLGHADRERRMMLIAVGAALENMRVAGEHLGYQASVTELDADARFRDTGYCASLQLEKRSGGSTHPWFDALFTRQTTRTEFDPLLVPPVRLMQTLQSAADLPGIRLQWFRAPRQLRALAALNRASVRSFLAEDRNHRDGMRWFRISRTDWERHGDGIAVFNGDAPWIAKQYVQTMMSTEDVMGDAFKQAEIDIVDRLAAATPIWGLIHAERSSDTLRVQAGRLAERAYLEAAANGCALQPLCYATETEHGRDLLQSAARLPSSAEPLFLFRLGHSEHFAKSVRRPLAQVLV